MAELFKGRYTAAPAGEFVVFLIGGPVGANAANESHRSASTDALKVSRGSTRTIKVCNGWLAPGSAVARVSRAGGLGP